MYEGDNIMKHLYLASDNAMNYLIIRDMERDENDTAVVNWDLSDDEIKSAVAAFEANQDDDSFYAGEELEYEPFETVMNRMNQFEHVG